MTAGGNCYIPRMNVRQSLPALLPFLAIAVLILASSSSGFPVQRSDAEVQLEFGTKVAMKGSWNEAVYRFERATKLDPSLSHAWNNLAVAMENLGRFDEAAAAYGKALELSPDDTRIKENHERFQEFRKYHTRKATDAPAPDAP